MKLAWKIGVLVFGLLLLLPQKWVNADEDNSGSKFVGTIQGLPAYALLSIENQQGHTIVSGSISSHQYRYSFVVEVVGGSGYGDMISHNNHEKFRIKFDHTDGGGFRITTHPLNGTPSVYYFDRRG